MEPDPFPTSPCNDMASLPEWIRKRIADCPDAFMYTPLPANLRDKLIDYYDLPFAEDYLELRKHKGVIVDMAWDRMSDPTYFATMMVYKGFADGMVSGSVATTAQTIRPAFEFVKTKPGHSIVSSVFLMCLKDRVLVYGDCAVNPNPDARQLAASWIVSGPRGSKLQSTDFRNWFRRFFFLWNLRPASSMSSGME